MYKYPDERTYETVYRGKISHGSNFDTCCLYGCQSTGTEFPFIECLYFKDYRNPCISSTHARLLPLQMAVDVGGPIGDKLSHETRNDYSQPACHACENNNWYFFVWRINSKHPELVIELIYLIIINEK